jgi:hypothetical protein
MTNGNNENETVRHRRRGYLAYFKDGVHDAIINEKKDEEKTFSDYYKQGYKHGEYIKDQMIIKETPYG